MTVLSRDRRLHVRGSRVDTLVESKLQGHARVSLAAFGSDQLQPVDLHELPLQRRGDSVGYRIRTGTGIAHLHLDDGIVHRRQIVYRQPQITEYAEQHARDGQDRRHHRPAYEELGEIHDLVSALVGAGVFSTLVGSAMRTLPPGVTPSWPVITTRSPELMPLLTTTRSPWR